MRLIKGDVTRLDYGSYGEGAQGFTDCIMLPLAVLLCAATQSP